MGRVVVGGRLGGSLCNQIAVVRQALVLSTAPGSPLCSLPHPEEANCPGQWVVLEI